MAIRKTVRKFRKTVKKPTTMKKVARVAQRVVNKNIETKKKQDVINELTIDMGTAPVGYEILDDESYRLQQGDGYSNMTGHHVKAVGHSMNLYMNNTNNFPVFGRLMWLYSRTGVLPDDVSIYLTEGNNADVSLNNNLLELHQRVNKDQFLILKSWNFRLGSSDGTSSLAQFKNINHYHNHKGRKMIYNGTNTFPVNGRFFYVLMVRRPDNDGLAVSNIEISAVSNFYFKDG